MGIIRWCLLNLLSAFFPVRSASWIVPYLKPLNFIPSTIIYRTVLPIFPYWKIILCCHVLPKTSANGIPSSKIISGKTDSSGSRLDRKNQELWKPFEIVSHISTLWISSHLQNGTSNISHQKKWKNTYANLGKSSPVLIQNAVKPSNNFDFGMYQMGC